MGKGDLKTGKGKRVNGSYGKTRKRKSARSTSKHIKNTASEKVQLELPELKVKKTRAKKKTTEE